MKTIRTKFLSLLLALVTILSLLPTAAFAASNTGSGLKITTNQAYWSTRLLANGTPYSYRPPLVDGKLVYCMDSGLGYHYATASYLNSFTWTSGTGADADAVLQSAVTNSGLSEMDAATVENVKWMMTYLNDCKESNVGQLFMAVQTYVWENQSYKGEPGGDGDAGGYANADTYELYLSLIDSLLAKKAAEERARKAEEERVAHRQEIVDFAMQFEGNPYVYGGTSLTNGADCSGFMMSVFKEFGYELPRVAAAQYESSQKKELSDIEVGDLVFYGSNIYHVGLYIGDEKIIHASTSASGIKVSDYDFEIPSGVGTYLK